MQCRQARTRIRTDFRGLLASYQHRAGRPEGRGVLLENELALWHSPMPNPV